MTAYITFSKEDTIKVLEKVWCIPYLKDLCRLAPVIYTKEDFKKRNEFTLKLANLPFGITAFDLKDLVEMVKAKTCFIPHTHDKYSRQ